jgi:glycosyltransferase involved in cell wall biosynthesis
VEATVVITVYRRRHFVDRAIQSALSQTLREIEVIVIEDGSIPPIEPRVRDERLVVIRNEVNLGLGAARNRGLAAASGRWVTFLDDDDQLAPRMLDASLEAAARSRLPAPVAVLSALALVDPEGHRLETLLPPTLARGRHWRFPDLAGRSHQVANSLVAPTTVLRSIGGWDECMPIGWSNDDMFLRLNAVASLQGSDELGYLMTEHAERATRLDIDHSRARAIDRTLQKHRSTFELYPRQHAHLLGNMGVCYLRAGDWARAVQATTRALRVDPGQGRLYVWWLASLAGPRLFPISRRLRRRYYQVRRGDSRQRARRDSNPQPSDP